MFGCISDGHVKLDLAFGWLHQENSTAHKPPECAHQELDIAVAPGRTMQNPMSRRQDTKLRHLVTNNSGGQQCSSWSNNCKQKQTAPTQGHLSFTQARDWSTFINFSCFLAIFFHDITSKAFNHCHAGGDCEMQATKPKSQATLQRGHTHTHTRTYFTSFKKLLCFQVQGREPLGGNYWLLAISLAKEAS